VAKIVKSFLESKLLSRKIPYRIILPGSYFENKHHYPVLYLLHGLFGNCDNWLDLSDVRDCVREKDLIIVLPEGEESWYCDQEKQKFESCLIKELIPEIEDSLRTIKEKRAIAGLSMGGYGALKFGLKYPDMFTFCGSMSGALMAPQLTRENCRNDWLDLLPSVEKVFGQVNTQIRIENDLFKIIKDELPENIAALPFFYLDCGIDDSFLAINRELAGLLKEKKVRHFYREADGGHDWDYWSRQIKEILPLVEKEFAL
jgi:putative tributyrin esterase